MEHLKAFFLSERLWISAAVILVTVAVWLGLKPLLRRLKCKADSAKAAANIRLLGNVLRAILAILAVLSVLQINGINVSSWLTGLGIVGIIVGFALQDILKDIIMGVNIAIDHYFSVGDVVTYGGTVGEVVYFSIRITKIRDLDSRNVMTVSNRNISEITRIESRIVTHVPVPYGLGPEKTDSLCRQIAERMAEIDGLTGCTYEGIDSFGESMIVCTLYAEGAPRLRDAHRRAINHTIASVFAENGVDIPFNQLDVHLDDRRK